MNFNNGIMGIVNNPLTNSVFVDDYNYLSAPTPPGSDERITEAGEIRITEAGEIRITED